MAVADVYSSLESLLEGILTSLRDGGALQTDRDQPVVQFLQPADLKAKDFLQDLGEAVSEERLTEAVQEIIKYSVRTQHPLFLNQLYGGTDPVGLAGAWLTEALNTNQYTFEVAPVFTMTELAIIKRLLCIVGYNEGDGIFAPGGSMANMYAIVLARYKKCPEIKRTGVSSGPPLALFTSCDGHYSLLKAAHWLGLGLDQLYMVESDASGRMSVAALAKAVERAHNTGHVPFFVNATAGSTVLGSYDPLRDIAHYCKQNNLWLHVDACWGGALLFSEKYKSVMDGVELSDSISWNPHKMLGAPLQCSIILLKEEGLLHKSNNAAATYLFQQDKYYDTTYDLGDKSVQCGRKPDSLKLWLMWRARGDQGFGSLVECVMDLSRYFLEQIRKRKDFHLVLPEFQCSNICFWYIPECLEGLPETEDWWERLGNVAPLIKKKMVVKGSVMIGYQPMKSKKLPNFFRLVLTCHPQRSQADMDRVITEIADAGRGLKV